MGCASVQIFGTNPRQWRAKFHGPETVAAWRATRARHDVGPVFSHAIYLINLGSDDRAIYAASVRALVDGLRICAVLDLAGLIFHVGSSRGRSLREVLPRIVPALARVLEESDTGVPLLLENSAGAGGVVGAQPAELGLIIDAMHGHPRLRLCLDSAHAFASGYDVRRPDEMDHLVDDLRQTVGLDRLAALHVNDSKAPLGSNRDRHANLGEGEIGLGGLASFLTHPAFAGLPALLETPGFDGKGPDAYNLEIACALTGQGRYTPRGALRRARAYARRLAGGSRRLP